MHRFIGKWIKLTMYRGKYLTTGRHLKPGQWFEHVEYGIDMKSDDGSLLPDSAIVRASTVSLFVDFTPI